MSSSRKTAPKYPSQSITNFARKLTPEGVHSLRGRYFWWRPRFIACLQHLKITDHHGRVRGASDCVRDLIKIHDSLRSIFCHHAVDQIGEYGRKSAYKFAERVGAFCFICVPGKPTKLSVP